MKISKFLQFLKNRWRILTGLFIIAAAVSFSASLIFRHEEKNPPQPPFVISQNTRPEPSGNLRFSLTPLSNLTDQFIDKTLEKLMAENQNINTANGLLKDANKAKVLPDLADVEQIISSLIDKKMVTEKIDLKEIIVGTDYGEGGDLLYFILVQELIKNELKEISAIELDTTKSITDYFAKIAIHFEGTVNLLKNMKVPASFKDLHIQLAEFFLKQRNIFESLALAKADPLNFYIAAYRLLPLEAEKELKDIMNRMVDLLIKNEKTG